MLQWHLSREFFSDAKPQTPITEVKLCDKIVDPPKVWRFSQATLTIFQKRRDSISQTKNAWIQNSSICAVLPGCFLLRACTHSPSVWKAHVWFMPMLVGQNSCCLQVLNYFCASKITRPSHLRQNLLSDDFGDVGEELKEYRYFEVLQCYREKNWKSIL